MHNLFLWASVVTDIALTAFWRALCLLWCKKLKIPLKAKPKNPEIIVPKIPFISMFFLKILAKLS